MCLVVYIAANSSLPLIPWQPEAPTFNVTELTQYQQPVFGHLPLPHVRLAGSHTSCGCGFNEGRESPQAYDDPVAERAKALESAALLAQYIREHGVQQIYACWSGDEGQPQEFRRHVCPDDLVAPEFVFRERELLIITQDVG